MYLWDVLFTSFCWSTIAPWSSSTLAISTCPPRHAPNKAVSRYSICMNIKVYQMMNYMYTMFIALLLGGGLWHSKLWSLEEYFTIQQISCVMSFNLRLKYTAAWCVSVHHILLVGLLELHTSTVISHTLLHQQNLQMKEVIGHTVVQGQSVWIMLVVKVHVSLVPRPYSQPAVHMLKRPESLRMRLVHVSLRCTFFYLILLVHNSTMV